MVRVVAAAVVLAAGLSGCSGESTPIETPETVGIPGTALPIPGEGATSSVPPPTSSGPSATSASAAGSSEGPLMTADPADSPSAVAFVKEYFAAYNQAFRNPPQSRLADYALPSCKTCQQFQKRIDARIAQKVHQNTDAVVLRKATSQFDLGLPGVVVEVDQLPAVSLDESGRRVSQADATPGVRLILFLDKVAQRWKVAEIKVYEGRA